MIIIIDRNKKEKAKTICDETINKPMVFHMKKQMVNTCQSFAHLKHISVISRRTGN